MRTIHSFLFVVPLLTGLCLAQQSSGPIAGTALAVAVQGGANGSADATTHVRRSGFGAAVQQFPAVPGAPDLQAILTLHGAPNLDIDDISTGRDDIMVDGSGFVDPPPFGWGMFSFSFRDGAQGLPGSRLAAEPAADRGAAVFSWVLPGSLIPMPLIDQVERTHSRTELGLLPSADVDSLDLPLVLGLDQSTLNGLEPGFQTLQPPMAEIYFTVSASSLALVPAAWWIYGFGPTPPSGATIFRTFRPPTGSTWSVPAIYKPYFAIGLQQNEDIDGLALDCVRDLMVFSCVGNARDQLLFVDCNTDLPTPTPVKKPGGTPVSQAVGSAGVDDIDAVCTLDPRIRNGLYVPDDFGASCGTPRNAYMPNLYPVGVSASAIRRFANGQSFYDTFVIGWPSGAPAPGLAVCLITLGDSLSPVITARIAVRNPAASTAGDPQRFTQPIPPFFVLSGLPLTFRWFAADNGGSVMQAYPIKVFL